MQQIADDSSRCSMPAGQRTTTGVNEPPIYPLFPKPTPLVFILYEQINLKI